MTPYAMFSFITNKHITICLKFQKKVSNFHSLPSVN